MADSDELSIQPAEVSDVTQQLDALAGRVQRVMADEAPNLAVTASARDEVSQRVASTLNEVHSSFGAATDQGLGEMRDVASTLRTHSNNVVASDQEV
jgi:hypothetical protein